MSAAIKKRYNVETELEKAESGSFEVYKNGKKIFSKLKTGRFPTNKEILDLLAKKEQDQK